MAFDNTLANRVRMLLENEPNVSEKKMMGGLTFMVNEKMCVGIVKDELMCRIHPDVYDESLQRKGCKIMTFTGKEMKGYVFVTPEGTETDNDLKFWVDLALAFNPFAQASTKKKKSS